MSLFRETIRPPAILSDEAVERYLAAIRAELTPDPLFRRRLRGEVMNRYVASREGIAATHQRRTMGRLGRAVLYATFTLALTTTSVLAASQEALPGDLLYPLKRQVENLRMEVLPASLHHDLAAYELAERIDELSRLAVARDSASVAVMAAVVAQDYQDFQAEADATGETEDRFLPVLTALLNRLPDAAHDAVEAVVDRPHLPGNASSPGVGPAGSGPSNNGNGPGRNSSGGDSSGGSGAGVPGVPNGNANGNGPEGPGKGEATPKPTKSPKPDPTPRETRAPNRNSVKTPAPHPTPNAEPDEDPHGP